MESLFTKIQNIVQAINTYNLHILHASTLCTFQDEMHFAFQNPFDAKKQRFTHNHISPKTIHGKLCSYFNCEFYFLYTYYKYKQYH